MNKILLKEIVNVIAGQSPESIYYNNNGDGMPFLQGNRTFGRLYPFIDTWTNKITKRANAGDILISVRAPVGDLNISNQEICIGRGIAALAPKNVSNRFVFYCLKYNLKTLLSSSSGTTFSSVNRSDLENLELVVPEKKNWEQIIKILSALDDKIEVNNKINAELEAMVKTLYDYWFVQFDFPNEDNKPYKSSGGKMVYNKTLKREIPEGWKAEILDNLLIEFTKGITTSYVEKSNLINLNQKVNKGAFLERQYFKYLDESIEVPKSKFAKRGDVLINSLGQGTLGRVHYFIDNDNNIVVDQHLFILRTNYNKVTSSYLYNTLSSKAYQIQIDRQITGSTGMQMLNASNLKDLQIIKPELGITEKFENIVSKFYDKISVNEKQNQELTQLRDWLLPMLMNGQVRVSEVGIADRITEYANSEVSHEKLVAETFGEYLPKKQHNINDINKELAALVYLMNYGLGVNYGNVAVQKAVYNSSVITPNLYSKKHDFINYNFGTFSKGLADDLSHNPYLKTKKINGFEVYEIEPSKKNEILNVLSSAENKDFVSSINKLIDLYRLPFINKETNKMELLNTVLKIYSDLKTTDIEIIYQAMKDWKIKQDKYSTKAEKFSKQDTQQMIELLLRNNILR